MQTYFNLIYENILEPSLSTIEIGRRPNIEDIFTKFDEFYPKIEFENYFQELKYKFKNVWFEEYLSFKNSEVLKEMNDETEEYEGISYSGRGVFGYVWKVKEKKSGKIFARKTIKFETEKQENEIKKEIEIMREITEKKVQTVVKLIKSWKIGNIHQLILEYCDKNLYEFLDDHKNFFKLILSSKQNFGHDRIGKIEFMLFHSIARDILESLIEVHNLFYLHGDLCPANVLLNEEANDGHFIKLCDFGKGTILNKKRSKSGKWAKYKYTAPECSVAGKRNEKSDLYSLSFIISNIFEDILDW